MFSWLDLYRAIFYVLCSYSLFYFSYKYYLPWSGGNDFSRYYPMYQSPLDFTAAPAPFVYRQLSAIATNIVYKLGLYYRTEISFRDTAYDQRIFFAALFSNYLFLAGTAVVVSRTTDLLAGRPQIASLLAGCLVFLSFHAQPAVITGLTDGGSWFLISLLFLVYLRRGVALFVVLTAIAIFQREIILAVFEIFAIVELVRRNDTRYNFLVLCSSATGAIVYLIIRSNDIIAVDYSHQTDITRILPNILSFRPGGDWVFQVLISQNSVGIYLALSAALRIATGEGSKWTVNFILAFGAIVLIGIVADQGNNIGRVAGMLAPIFAAGSGMILARLEPFFARGSG